jgi:hypothetical protein
LEFCFASLFSRSPSVDLFRGSPFEVHGSPFLEVEETNL